MPKPAHDAQIRIRQLTGPTVLRLPGRPAALLLLEQLQQTFWHNIILMPVTSQCYRNNSDL